MAGQIAVVGQNINPKLLNATAHHHAEVTRDGFWLSNYITQNSKILYLFLQMDDVNYFTVFLKVL